VSGIDKAFDYLVPDSLIDTVSVGDKVRINLHGRRVGGWIIAIGEHGSKDFSDVPREKLVEITKHSGQAVVSHLIPLAIEVANRYFGPLRAVLQSASSPRVTRSRTKAQHGKIAVPDDGVAAVAQSDDVQMHVVTIQPLDSVLSLVAALAVRGPVLVVCPTVRMAVLGAASLRRRGCAVALMPDDWDKGLDGVDVAIGARSAVWAPLAGISSVVVVDEHDDSLKEERVPTWHAREVAIRRAQIENASCYLCSPLLSVEAMSLVSSANTARIEVESSQGWPVINVADLNEVPVSGSLASSEMLQLVRRRGESVLCILNTKGRARLLACAKCRTLARCSQCQTVMSAVDSQHLHCDLCDNTIDAICDHCGRTSFRVLRAGIGSLREEIAKASGRDVVEVDASTEVLDLSEHDGVYVGTEALLHRVSGAQHVVILDFDAEIMAPRATATRDACALIIRAARVVGRNGTILLQTRNTEHDLVSAFARLHLDAAALGGWEEKDLALRRALSLPPFTSMARVRLDDDVRIEDVCSGSQVTWANEYQNSYIVRSDDVSELRNVLSRARKEYGQRIRIEIDPVRY
jgi:primosomal protein N' (replication factor Y)